MLRFKVADHIDVEPTHFLKIKLRKIKNEKKEVLAQLGEAFGATSGWMHWRKCYFCIKRFILIIPLFFK